MEFTLNYHCLQVLESGGRYLGLPGGKEQDHVSFM